MMINRRDLILGGACVAALGASEYLRPRRIQNLLGNEKFNAVIPRRFGQWTSNNGGDIVIPQTQGSLSERLYAQQVMRTYLAPGTPAPLMLLIAYGASQSDTLQLHRPESCYPAVGFAIARRQLARMPIAPGVDVPAVMLTAQATGRQEDIVYWTRLGEYLPQTAGQQRRDRLETSMQGYIGDGVLVRASMVRDGDTPLYPLIGHFLAEMVMAMRPDTRKVLVGTGIASVLAGSGGSAVVRG